MWNDTWSDAGCGMREAGREAGCVELGGAQLGALSLGYEGRGIGA